MRLIDAERLRALIVAMYEPFPNICNVNVVLTAIDNAPTIEAEPVRHGRWITKDSKTAKCSCCGWWQHAKMYYLPDDIKEFSKCYIFCTACGAKMNGGADNGNG